MGRTRELIIGSNTINTKHLLGLCKGDLRLTTGALTGHWQLRRHLHLAQCYTQAMPRRGKLSGHTFLGRPILSPKEVKEMRLSGIESFMKSTKLLYSIGWEVTGPFERPILVRMATAQSLSSSSTTTPVYEKVTRKFTLFCTFLTIYMHVSFKITLKQNIKTMCFQK